MHETPAQRFSAVTGFERTSARDGRSEVRLRIAPRHLNELGIVHGGVLMALADEAIGMAAFSAVPPGTAVVTAELHVHFLLPARSGLLVAQGVIWRAGRRLVTGEATIDLYPEEGTPITVAKATGTWATVTQDVPLP
ncbi:PaaI family thioesterase [Carboxydochorda subterranea]|uniref:Medium/long-chain acyl-CoA thioesterase YigI n=1 Tax=Carboxydichorda subterranea TaxID=3109565 RepID=A0ABZ1BXT8_9FIRM|nr:PaaI family thioesterase [Limnochorda sp. L945t]WRP16882.1 PaaI family thioesterase [Limnochorda sp. L945t]